MLPSGLSSTQAAIDLPAGTSGTPVRKKSKTVFKDSDEDESEDDED